MTDTSRPFAKTKFLKIKGRPHLRHEFVQGVREVDLVKLLDRKPVRAALPGVGAR